MSQTLRVPGSTDAQTAWYIDLYEETEKLRLLVGLEGGRNAVIHRINELEKAQGGTVKFGLRRRIDEGFLPSGTDVSGNETELNTLMDSIIIEEKIFGIKDAGPLSRQVVFYDMDKESKQALAEQAATNTDREYIDALYTRNDIVFYESGGTAAITATLATATEAVTSADKVSPEMITKLKNFAQSFRGSGFIPIRPVDVGTGEKAFIFLTNHEALTDMENDSTFVASQQLALERSKSNPLFKGSYAYWRGVIFFVTDNGIQTGTNTSSVPYVHSHFLGAQALCSAHATMPEIVEEKDDYGRKHGMAYLSMWNTGKSKFATNSGSNMQYGSINVVTATAQLTNLTLS